MSASPVTNEISIEALVDEFERCSNEVALSGYGHEFDPGKRYKQEARDEALTDLMRAINNLRASATASEKRVAELVAKYETNDPSKPTQDEAARWNGSDQAGAVRAFRARLNCGLREAVDAFRAMEKANG